MEEGENRWKNRWIYTGLALGVAMDGLGVIASVTDGIRVLGNITVHWPVWFLLGLPLITLGLTPAINEMIGRRRAARFYWGHSAFRTAIPLLQGKNFAPLFAVNYLLGRAGLEPLRKDDEELISKVTTLAVMSQCRDFKGATALLGKLKPPDPDK